MYALWIVLFVVLLFLAEQLLKKQSAHAADPAPTILTELVTSTMEAWLEANWIDLTLTDDTGLNYLYSKAKTKVGARYLNGSISVKEPTADTETGRLTDLRDPIPLSGPTAMKAQYTWARYGRRPGIDYSEVEDNRGEEVVADLMQSRLEMVLSTMSENLKEDLWALATTSGGVKALYETMKTAAGVAVGGVDTGLGWTPQVARTLHATTPVTSSTVAKHIRLALRAIRAKNGRCDVIFVSPTVYTKLEDEVATNTQFVPLRDGPNTPLGFSGFTYQGAIIIEEPWMEEETAESAGSNDDVVGWFLAMDCRKNYLVRSREKPWLRKFMSDTTPIEGYQCLISWQFCPFALNRMYLHEYAIHS